MPRKRQQKSKELSQLAEQREARKEDGSVKGDKTVRDSRSAYLVRSIVSAQPLIICTAEAGLRLVYCSKGRFSSGKRVFPCSPVSPVMTDGRTEEANCLIKSGCIKSSFSLLAQTVYSCTYTDETEFNWTRPPAPNPDPGVKP